MNQLLQMFRVLRYGAELRHAEAWKKRATAVAALTGVLSALTGIAVARGWLHDIDPQTIMEVASALVTLVSAVLSYFQVATSARVGVGKTAAEALPPVAEVPASRPFPGPDPDAEFVARTTRLHKLEAAFGDAPKPPDHAARQADPDAVPPPGSRQRRDGDSLDTNPFLFS